jgi:hypothetical protein
LFDGEEIVSGGVGVEDEAAGDQDSAVVDDARTGRSPWMSTQALTWGGGGDSDRGIIEINTNL